MFESNSEIIIEGEEVFLLFTMNENGREIRKKREIPGNSVSGKMKTAEILKRRLDLSEKHFQEKEMSIEEAFVKISKIKSTEVGKRGQAPSASSGQAIDVKLLETN